MRLLSSSQMRDADSAAIHIHAVPSTWLMTNASEQIAKAALDILPSGGSAVIFCGAGNNGGDGVSVASKLLLRSVPVHVFLVGDSDKMTDDTKEMSTRLAELGTDIKSFSSHDPEILDKVKKAGVIIDAIFGIGLKRDLKGDALAAVQMINESDAPVVSADIASGVEADTGRILGDAVRADITVTFSVAKPGHFVEPGCVCCGKLRIADIGIPGEILNNYESSVYAVTKSDISLPRRKKLSHKGHYGRLLLIGGSVGYTGAPTLAAKAALRMGAGLVSLGVPREIYQITAVKNEEAMPFPLASRDGKICLDSSAEISGRWGASSVAVIGMGLDRSEDLSQMLCSLLRKSEIPTVVDADGLFAIKDDMKCISESKAPVILSPHEGEFLRIGGTLSGDRIADAKGFSQKHGCVLVLKGHRTICAFPDGEVYIIAAGNPGMAKGGSGDVLAGMLGAAICQFPLKKAVITAAWLHARAGDICSERFGEYAMNAGDIIEALYKAELEIIERNEN